jgi:hypothetical protein
MRNERNEGCPARGSLGNARRWGATFHWQFTRALSPLSTQEPLLLRWYWLRVVLAMRGGRT